MSDMKKIGAWFLALGGFVLFFSRQKLSAVVKGVYLNGGITATLIPLRVVVDLVNKTIGTVFVRGISGALISDGFVVASVNQQVNKRIRANRVVEQSIFVDIHNQEALNVILANIQTGDVNNLALEFIGEVVVGEQWPVGIKFNKIFTWQDIRKIL